jgi:ABC-type oligopeptide transport system substrate-binding subunit
MNTFKRKSAKAILAAVLGTSMVLLAACSNSGNNAAETGNSNYGNSYRWLQK